MRSLLVPVLLLAVTPALAQGEPSPGDDRRYQFNQVMDGTLRLDLRSGQVSLCSRRPAGWACTLVPDERAALEDELARLQSENAALKKALLDRGAEPPGVTRREPPAAGDTKRPSDAEIDRVMTTLERVWRRLVDMLINLQKEFGKT